MARLRLGPRSNGRPLTFEELAHARRYPGYWYELVAGRLAVQPWKSVAQAILASWLFERFIPIASRQRKSPLYCSAKPALVTGTGPGASWLRPDFALFTDFPYWKRIGELTWEDLQPFIVVEVLDRECPPDLVARKTILYRRIPSVYEVWRLDARASADRPTLTVIQRSSLGWTRRKYKYGDTYECDRLPGFSLRIDPRD